MAVNINVFKLFTEYAANKSQSGGTLTISQFNEVCNRAQISLFETDFQTFVATEKISEYLKTFLKNQVLSISSLTGEANYPSDFQHLASLRKYFVPQSGAGKMINVKEVDNVSYGFAQISSLNAPSLRFPIYSEFSNVIRFLPKNIAIVDMDYFKTPVAPVWGFTTANNRPVYDPNTSVNFEWSDFSTNQIAGIFLSMIGINLSQAELINWSNQFREINKSIA